MEAADAQTVLPMVYCFYRSDAVDHPVPEENLQRTFQAAVTPGSLIDGYVLEEEGKTVGFAYLTAYYACEVGGVNLMIEEIYLEPEARGKGYCTQFFHWMEEAYPDVKRFRLEVTETNGDAIRLYQKLGFDFLRYGQMAKDR